MDYQIQPHSRHCTLTGRELHPGEQFFTVLVEQDQHLVRRDYSCDAWQGPPNEAFSFWQGRIPADNAPRRLVIDDEILVECFQRLEGATEPHKVNFRYVVALLLMRRKRFRFDDAVMEDGQEVLVLRCVKNKETYRVANPRLTDEQILAVQDEVFKVLGWN